MIRKNNRPHPAAPIVLADEDPSLLASLKLILLGSGFNNIRLANQRKEIIPLLSREPCSLLIMDIYFRDLRGAQAAALIRARFPEVPILVMSALEDLETAVSCMRAGVADYLLKPVALDAFLTTVKRNLRSPGPIAGCRRGRTILRRPDPGLSFLQGLSQKLCSTRKPPCDPEVTRMLEKLCRIAGFEKAFPVLFPKDQQGAPRAFFWPTPLALPGPRTLMDLFRDLLPVSTHRPGQFRARLLDTSEDDSHFLARLGSSAGIILPLLQEEETAGILCLLSSRRKRRPLPTSLQFIEIAGNLAFSALSRRLLQPPQLALEPA